MHDIDTLTPGSSVRIEFDGGTTYRSQQTARFIGIQKGEDEDDREAMFETREPDDGVTAWTARRYRGRWAYGQHAGRVSVLRVLDSHDTPHSLWEDAKARGFITGDGQRVMVTQAELEAVYARGREDAQDED